MTKSQWHSLYVRLYNAVEGVEAALSGQPDDVAALAGEAVECLNEALWTLVRYGPWGSGPQEASPPQVSTFERVYGSKEGKG